MRRMVTGAIASLACWMVVGCTADAPEAQSPSTMEVSGVSGASAALVTAPPTPASATAADSAAEIQRLTEAAEALRVAFAGVPLLRAREVAELRRDVNATQIASARRLGVRVGSPTEMERLHQQGRLVALQDSTEYWILRRLEHSAPYVTPDLELMLIELGRRFHARLEQAGLPLYRMRLTSILRTDADQAALRNVNRNASRIVSAHEFGTTVDVSHERFAVPAAEWIAAGTVRLPELEIELLEEVGKEHSRALQAELGRAIWEMRQEGYLHVMMEDSQPVYHMTVARGFAPR